MGTKNRNRRIADFFCFTITLFVFCFPHTTLSCPSLSSKKHDNIDNKDNISFLFQKCCPKLTLVVVKKNHLFMKIFIFVSENIKMFCLGNISLSLKSTIRFFLIRISPIQCVRERDGGLRGGSINDGLFHLLMLGNAWVKSLINLVQCVTEQKMY